MALLMLSLAGIPPLAGFMAKLYVFSAAVQAGLVWLAVLGVINSVISAYYYLRIVVGMYMKEPVPVEGESMPVCPALAVGVALASAVTVVLGIWPTPILELAHASIVALVGG
jgi:NADH-quinone oxidoreductase subunit N